MFGGTSSQGGGVSEPDSQSILDPDMIIFQGQITLLTFHECHVTLYRLPQVESS